MAEEQAEAEQDKGAQSEQEGSTLGRLKSRVKDLVGKDAEEQDVSGDEQETSSEGDSSQTDAEGSDEESASGDEQEGGEQEDEGDGKVGEYSIDDADPSQQAENEDEARAQMLKLEKDGPPENLADWPTGKAMYLTFGGAEGEASYEGAASSQLGPSSTRHHADGSVEVQGETVDDPDSYKGDKSVFDEADEIGMDKSGKNEDDESEDDGSAEEGSAEAQSGDESSGEQASSEASSSEESSGQASSDTESSGNSEAQGESSSEATARSGGAESDSSGDQQAESETTGTS